MSIGVAVVFLVVMLLSVEFANHFRTHESFLVGFVVFIGGCWSCVSVVVGLDRLKKQNPTALRFMTLGAATGAIPAYVWVIWPAWVLHKFEAHRQAYLAVAQASVVKGYAYIRGKIVPLDLRGDRISPFLFDLPRDLRPSEPNEVGSVVTLNCDQQVVGTYSGSGQALQWRCLVRVYDGTVRTLVFEEVFLGSKPPGHTYNSDAVDTGAMPYDSIRNGLMKLPLRNF